MEIVECAKDEVRGERRLPSLARLVIAWSLTVAWPQPAARTIGDSTCSS